MKIIDNQFEKTPDNNNYIRFGLMSALIIILTSLVFYFTDTTYAPWAKWISGLLMFGLLIVSLKFIADSYDKISFGKLFGMGFKMTLIITVISLIYMAVYMNFLEPDFLGKVMQVSREAMEKKGTLSEEQIDNALEISKKFMNPTFMLIMSAISSIIMGSIYSLIGSAIFKKE